MPLFLKPSRILVSFTIPLGALSSKLLLDQSKCKESLEALAESEQHKPSIVGLLIRSRMWKATSHFQRKMGSISHCSSTHGTRWRGNSSPVYGILEKGKGLPSIVVMTGCSELILLLHSGTNLLLAGGAPDINRVFILKWTRLQSGFGGSRTMEEAGQTPRTYHSPTGGTFDTLDQSFTG